MERQEEAKEVVVWSVMGFECGDVLTLNFQRPREQAERGGSSAVPALLWEELPDNSLLPLLLLSKNDRESMALNQDTARSSIPLPQGLLGLLLAWGKECHGS